MRYRTNQGLLIEAASSAEAITRLRESSWNEQNLSDHAYMEAVADRMFQEGIHVSTLSPDMFIAGLLSGGLLTRDTDEAQPNTTKQETER
ncbi:hypothetical protein [Nitrobacter sp. JJSN]|jgi:hypothetical protein|uniref:hypothetical protein n=1 Tax=Nitrobacter sp. JJSN TaxID=3453033 RepID=UPI003F7588FE